ncbi:hypothetical protein NE237_007248 [Protea cynaroides]|uniref:Uncharacterized protein n=1 Tax=Protea cynaroides TaxID=273540 RepID=A0A9Q0KP50_9MAGN|nr:hypothetical protein NE237_007248 [Protea cynaroides]
MAAPTDFPSTVITANCRPVSESEGVGIEASSGLLFELQTCLRPNLSRMLCVSKGMPEMGNLNGTQGFPFGAHSSAVGNGDQRGSQPDGFSHRGRKQRKWAAKEKGKNLAMPSSEQFSIAGNINVPSNILPPSSAPIGGQGSSRSFAEVVVGLTNLSGLPKPVF